MMGNSTLRFADKGWNGSLGARFVGTRYITIENDQSVPAYTTMDLGAGYRFANIGKAKNVSVQLNVVNLLDKDYIGSVGTGGFAARGDIQTLQTGARRMIFLSVGSSF
jgi:iron complex outermembrane receptor protein